MKKIVFCLLFSFFVFGMVSCGEASVPLSETYESFETYDFILESETKPDPVTKEEVPTVTEHVHQYEVISLREATCTASGEKIFQCSCGENKIELLSPLSHKISSHVSCTETSVCSVCFSKIQDPLGHDLEGNLCVRCGLKIESPIYVLGMPLEFDIPMEKVEEKLGIPTEKIIEGDLVSLVYAADPTRLTIVQTDPDGLWGVFTLDESARFFLDGKALSIASFTGIRDLNSEAYYQDIGSCRVFGFRDALTDGDFYGLWMRYSECDYDYMNDPRLCTTYGGQNRLSFYYVNGIRALQGLPVLEWSDEASAVAREYSETMIQEGFFYHDGSYANRLQQKGIFWKNAGENISQGYFNAFFVCDAYFNSQSHRANLLSVDFTHLGVGFSRQEDPLTVFGAQIFYSK